VAPGLTRASALFVASAALLAVSCDPAPTTTSGGTPTGSTVTSTSPPASGVDPLVPYSPPPREITDKLTGFAGDTFALPNAVGGTMHVTLLSTAIGLEEGPDGRPFSVWLTVANAEGPEWSGYPAGFVTVTDASGAVFEPIPNPLKRELHPDPDRYGVSNLDLHKPRTLASGADVSGVVVFRVLGGFRPVTIAISFDKGTTWGSWETSFGPS
jgi:hypothetical protein